MSRISLFGLEFENAPLHRAAELIIHAAKSGTKALVVTPNVDHIVTMHSDTHMRRIYETATFRFADGMPLVWLSRLLYKRGIIERVTGADLLPTIASLAAQHHLSIYLLGGLGGVAELAAQQLTNRYGQLRIAGTYSPPFGFETDDAECKSIVRRINESGADILFVGVGAPKQEKWSHAWISQLNVGAIIGCGAAFNFVAGTTTRAPRLVQNVGLEWAWRMVFERRQLWRRYIIKDSRFLVLACQELWRRWRKCAA